MKSTWKEIKDRVELKIGEKIDVDSFVTLANSSISDLNETAYVPAPPMNYNSNHIKFEDETYESLLSELFTDYGSSDDEQLSYNLKIVLPFEYNIGYNELNMECISSDNDLFEISIMEDELNVNNKSDSITLISTKTWNNFDKNLDNFIDGEIKITKKVMRLNNDHRNNMRNELYIDVPDNMVKITRMEIKTKDGNVSESVKSSINSFRENDYGFSTKNLDSIHYVNDGKIHIFTSLSVESIKLFFIRTMKKIKSANDLETQNTEFENGFENILTLSITHKWLENFVGPNDSETLNIYKMLISLKREYEENYLQRKIRRKQSSLIVR